MESHYAIIVARVSFDLSFLKAQTPIYNLHDILIELVNNVGNRIFRQLIWTRRNRSALGLPLVMDRSSDYGLTCP